MARRYASSRAPRLKLPSKQKRGRPSPRVTGKQAASPDRDRLHHRRASYFSTRNPVLPLGSIWRTLIGEANMHGPISRTTDHAQPRVAKGSWSQQGEHPHGVQFYSQDKFLLEELSEYVGNALRAGDAAVVIATEQHCDGLLPGLMAQGLDIGTLIEHGRFIVLDAAELLATFMVDGWPSPERFDEVVGEVITKALAC